MIKKKSLAIFFNAPYLGGAERSLLHQMKKIEGEGRELCFYIPKLNESYESSELEQNILELFPKAAIKTFNYPPELFAVSRDSSKLNALIQIVPAIFECYLTLRKLKLGRHQLFWANGNKIGFILWAYWLINRQSALIWHHRDYPAKSLLYRLAFRLVALFGKRNILHVANSFSVKASLNELFKQKMKTGVVYNPTGLQIKPLRQEVFNHPAGERVLAHVGMFAPWKGQMEFLQFLTTCSEKIMALGFSQAHFYGETLYQTAGEHQNYKNKILQIIKRWDGPLKISLITGKRPIEIFNNIDVLFHSSLREEPFGRVLVEAFSQGVPVLSTALGGAAELIGAQEERGEKLSAPINNFSQHWLEKLTEVITQPSRTHAKLELAHSFACNLDELIQEQLENVLKSVEVD